MSNAIAKRQSDFKTTLQSGPVRSAINRALPRHLKPEKIISAAMTAVSLQPKLLDCDSNTVLRSVILASQLGLEPGGALGSAYLVPYGRQCQLIVGYRGLIDLARRSGQVLGVEARVVYDCDEFHIEYGTESKVVHTPAQERPEGSRFLGAYAVIHIRDGRPLIEWMSKTEIDRIRNLSRAGKSGPWADHFDEMARKTVVRRAMKYAPLTTELATAIQADEQADRGEEQAGDIILDIAGEEEASTADELEREIAGEQEVIDA